MTTHNKVRYVAKNTNKPIIFFYKSVQFFDFLRVPVKSFAKKFSSNSTVQSWKQNDS